MAAAGLMTVAALGVAGAVLVSSSRVTSRGTGRETAGQEAGSSAQPNVEDDQIRLARAARPWVVNVVVATGKGSRSGSGAVVRAEGLVATSARLVDTAKEVDVTFHAGRTAKAAVLGADRRTDVAILRLDIGDLPAPVIGTAELVQLGDPVVVVGSPSGIQQVVATGSVGAMSRSVDLDGETVFDLLQINAAVGVAGAGSVVIGPGGSAIALVASGADPKDPFGYAIPIDVVRAVADQLESGRPPRHPWIGLAAESLDDESVVRLGGQGALVVKLFEGPASGHVQVGDVIVSIDGQTLQGAISLLKHVLAHSVSDNVALRLLRGGSERTVTLTIAEQPVHNRSA